MQIHDVLAALAILAGLVGIIVVIIPGLIIVTGGVLIWALIEGGAVGVTVGIITGVVAMTTAFFKYQRPGRRLVQSGVPTSHLLLASLTAVVGLFAVPIVGAPLFFVGTIYLLALKRHGRHGAWPATKAALRAVVHSVGIELAGGGVIAVVWLVGVLVS